MRNTFKKDFNLNSGTPGKAALIRRENGGSQRFSANSKGGIQALSWALEISICDTLWLLRPFQISIAFTFFAKAA